MADAPQRRRNVRRRNDRVRGWLVFLAFLGLAIAVTIALKQNHDDSVKGRAARVTQCQLAPISLKNYRDLRARGVITADEFARVEAVFHFCD